MPHLSVWLRRLTAAATIALLLALGWQCIDVYRDGSANVNENGVLFGDIYSAELVKARLEPFFLPVLIYAALVLLTAAVGSGEKEQLRSRPGKNRLRPMKAHISSRPADARKEGDKPFCSGLAGTGKRFPKGAVRLALYLLAAVLIASGVMNGGLRDVLVKAINICTECIGLG